MADTPAALGRRYLPFIAVIGVMVLLAAITPSRGPTSASGPSGGQESGLVPGVGSNSGGTGLTSAGSGPGSVDQRAANGAGGGSTSQSGGASIGTGGLGISSDRSDCTKDGRQIGPPGYVYMPPCVPVWHGGNNGGATMPGVTVTSIKFVYYRLMANPAIDAILAAAGGSQTTTQLCAAGRAYVNVMNKYWTLHGRKFVPLDGPGKNSGSAQQGCANFPFFQSQCNTAGDPPCDQAEAKVVASMHPAMVVGLAAPFFTLDLVALHVPYFTGGGGTRAQHNNAAPYYYGLAMTGDRLGDFISEYWCKKLNAKLADFAGADVKSTRNWGATPGATPTRKLAIIFPGTVGDNLGWQIIGPIKRQLTGGRCNSPGGVETIGYASDPTTAQQQADTIVQQLIAKHITTVFCACDPFAPLFLMESAQKQNYYPEYYGAALDLYEPFARLYPPAEQAHSFGTAVLGKSRAFAESDAVRWYHAGGGQGDPDRAEEGNVQVYGMMATAFQAAGPMPTPAGIARGLQNLPVWGGWKKFHDPHLVQVGFRSPDQWTGTLDVSEVYWNPTRNSDADGKTGSFCPVNGGERFNLGEIRPGSREIFNAAANGC